MNISSLNNAIDALRTSTGANSITPEILASIYQDILTLISELDSDLGLKETSIQTLTNRVNTFLNSIDASDATINRWKELENFLSGVTDTETLSGLLEELKTTLQTYINKNSSAISVEKQRATGVEKTLQEDITTINNTAVKSMVSTNEEFNNVVRELYFDNWFDMSQIKSVAISRKVLQGNTDVWQMYFISTDNAWAYAHFSVDPSVENDDICVGTIVAPDDTHPLYNKEIKVYAVIYWGLIAQNKQVVYTNVGLKYNTTQVKFCPIINHCIETHKYVHTIRGIRAIKELYIEDLKKNGVAVSKNDFEKYFSVQSIACNVVNGVLTNYQIALSDIREKNKHGTNGDKSEYIYIASYTYTDENNVFYLDKTINPSKPSADGILTGNTYSYKIYAVIDWSLMGKTAEGNYYYAITSQMLAGCLDKKNSPIIYNYIENEALRTQLAQLTASIDTTSEQE